MPWGATTAMRERVRFVSDFESCQWSMTELCELYGISRKTGYKWLDRYVKEGPRGLEDRSHVAKRFPHRISGETAEELLKLRQRFPNMGPAKMRVWLQARYPEEVWPAASTIGDLLKRHGLVKSRSVRRRSPVSKPRVEATSPNAVWSADFKGQFRLGNARLCHPLTVSDGFSRYLLGCQGLTVPSGTSSRVVFERLFRQYGLPKTMLTDNGSPFASSGAPARLSQLAVWWIRLGIHPVRIQPGHPEQNGRHERMHRTLKAETARPPAADEAGQQRRFDEFREFYNEERPHEALGQIPPARVYAASPRAYPERLPELEYPGHYEVRRVRLKGEIKWQGGRLFISAALQGQRIGLEEVDDGLWSVYLGTVLVARFDERTRRLEG